MAIGVMGIPLLRGNSDEIDTKFIINGGSYINDYSGRGVFSVLESNEKQNQSVQFLTTESAATAGFAGVVTADFMLDSDGVKAAAGVITKGNKIPVQIFGTITDLSVGVAVTESGLFTQCNETYTHKINASFRSSEIYQAYSPQSCSTHQILVDCALLDLYSGGFIDVVAPPLVAASVELSDAVADAIADAVADAVEAKKNNKKGAE